MKIAIWIVQIILMLAFLVSGTIKFVTPYNDLINSTPWVEDVNEIQIKLIALLEILGAIGLVLPMIFKKYKILVPLAASGLALVMISAMTLHILRDESIIPNLVLFALAVFVVYGRVSYFSLIE